jgi:type I restriction-modification system DNA methylase subunit
MFGQQLDPESYAICKADMLIKGQDVGNIVFGNEAALKTLVAVVPKISPTTQFVLRVAAGKLVPTHFLL